MYLLEGANLRKSYRLGRGNRVEALRGVDVRVEAGEMVAIMGPSGSGKSTLMHVLGLLHLPDPSHGIADPHPRPVLRFMDRDAISLGETERTKMRARQIGFVFQEFNLMATLTALENVLLAVEYAGVANGRRRALDALDMVGLQDRAHHRPSELSGGEQQRVAIARALVNEPALVLADEPTGNLDSARTGEVLDLLRRLNRQRGQTFVIVTHDPDVSQACDRIIRMRDGLIRQGSGLIHSGQERAQAEGAA